MAPTDDSRGKKGSRSGFWGKLRFLLVILLITLGFLELALRVLPPVVGGHAGNLVYSVYHPTPTGIYFKYPKLSMMLMRPNFKADGYWNGYRWDHQTDALGFRNAPAWKDGNILLLGDSMIYGHGAELKDSVSYALRDKYHRPVYNMARQGDCLYQHYALLRLYAEELRPKEVILFVFVNDFHDLLRFRTAVQVAAAPELTRGDYTQIRQSLREGDLGSTPWHETLFWSSKAVRLIGGAVSLIRTAINPGEPGQPAEYIKTILDEETFSLIDGYYRRILKDLNSRLKSKGAQLKIVLLDVGKASPSLKAEEGQAKLDSFLSALCQKLEIPYFRTDTLFRGCGQCFLKGDGHFSREGHYRLAGFLDTQVLSKGAPATHP